LDACPHYDGKVRPLCGADGTPTCRYRYVEDVVVAQPEFVEHAVRQYWCGSCRRRVEPAVTDALPCARLGLDVVVRTAVQHYLMGITISKVVALLRTAHGFDATPGGLAAAWRQLALCLAPDYAEMRAAALADGVLHADETGWRVDGARHWLWVFCTAREALFVVDRSRGGEVARTVLGEGFDGILVRDFYAAYARCSVKGTQFCLAHLLREFQKVEVRRDGDVGEEFARFRRLATAIFREAIRWSKDRPPDPAAGEAARERFERRHLRLDEEPHEDPDVVRLADRCLRSALGLFTFLTSPKVPPTNNWAELNLRPAVIARKNSYGNRSAQGADTQGVLMTVLRSLQLRKEDVVEATMPRVRKNLVENHRLKYTPPLGASDG
jgi:transposase